MSKKVIITGVTGQDGSYMAEYLLNLRKDEDKLIVYGVARRSSTPNTTNLKNVLKHPGFHLVYGDLSDSQSIDSLVKEIEPDYFVNLAAQSFVAASWNMPEQTFDVDAVGVIRCLEALRKHAPHCRFYNAGSSEEFGDVQFTPQTEEHPLRARSPYGAAKIAARQIVKVYRESYNLYAIQGILFNHESERRGEEFVTRKVTKAVAQIALDLKAGRVPTPLVLGNMEAKRDWSHAQDFVEGIWMLLNQESYNKRLHSAIYNEGSILLPFAINLKNTQVLSKLAKEYILSSNKTHSVREMVEEAFKAAGIEIVDVNPTRLEPTTEANGQQINYTDKTNRPLVVVSREFYRPAEVDVLHGDSTAARTDLGWKPSVSFEELVKRMVLNDIKLLTERQGTI